MLAKARIQVIVACAALGVVVSACGSSVGAGKTTTGTGGAAASSASSALKGLYAAALKDPTFTWAVSLPSGPAILKKFESTFPGIHGQVLATPASTSVQQIVTDVAAHKTPSVDVSFAPLTLASPLVTAGALQPIDWASLGIHSGLPLKQLDGHGVQWIDLVYCIGYNTSLTKPSDVPQSWAAVGQFKSGTIALDPRGDEFAIYALLENDNVNAAYQLAMQLSHRKVVLPATSGIRFTTLSSGHAAVGLGEHLGDLLSLRAKGAPVNWVPAAGVVLAPFFLYIPKGAKHLAAAKLFVAWAESRAGMEANNAVSSSSSAIGPGLPVSTVAKELKKSGARTVSEASYSLAQLGKAGAVAGKAAALFSQ